MMIPLILSMLATDPESTVLPEGLPRTMQFQEAAAPKAAPAEADKEEWTFDFAVYLWAPSLQGDLDVGSRSAEIDMEFSELVEDASAVLTLHFETWHRQRVGILIDTLWMGFQHDLNVGGQEAELAQRLAINEGLAGMRFAQDQVAFDLLMGLRWTYASSDLVIPGVEEKKRSRSLLDPVIGGRVLLQAAEWLLLSFRADVGGFGVGTEMSGQFVASAIFRLGDHCSLVVGWKSLAMEIEEDRYLLDVQMSGPLLAFNVGF